MVLTLRLISCVPEVLHALLPLSGKLGLKCQLNTPPRDAREIKWHQENESVLKSGKHYFFFFFSFYDTFPISGLSFNNLSRKGSDFDAAFEKLASQEKKKKTKNRGRKTQAEVISETDKLVHGTEAMAEEYGRKYSMQVISHHWPSLFEKASYTRE